MRPDDTLYSVAWRLNLDFRDLARWNDLGTDFRITVGQVLVLGPRGTAERRSAPVAPAPGLAPQPPGPARLPALPAPPAASPAPQPALPAPHSATRPHSAPPVPPASSAPRAAGNQGQAVPPGAPYGPPDGVPNGAQARWGWPTERIGAPQPVPNGGVLLRGRLGQDVRAASAGRVVYTGSGLRGYGNLIIIKHADNLLSAYAHNRELLVHDGQEVLMGQVIAHMGAAAQSPILYFEIRQSGRPVDPLRFLPK